MNTKRIKELYEIVTGKEKTLEELQNALNKLHMCAFDDLVVSTADGRVKIKLLDDEVVYHIIRFMIDAVETRITVIKDEMDLMDVVSFLEEV